MPSGKSTDPLHLLLVELDQAGLKWAIWKGLAELKQGFGGSGDLDILCAEDNETELRELVARLGWFQADWKRRPSRRIAHYFIYDGQDDFFHLHLYFGVTTGESGLKEYELPLEKLILDGRVFDPELSVWLPQPEVLHGLFVLRHFLKGGSFISSMVYRLELDSYRREWEFLQSRGAGLQPISVFQVLEIPNLMIPPGEFVPGRFSQSRRVRKSLRRFLRYPAWSLPPRRIIQLFTLLLRRILGSRGRFLFPDGLVLAFTGPDGSGKSTALFEVKRIFSKKFRVSLFHLGKPLGRGGLPSLMSSLVQKFSNTLDQSAARNVPTKSGKPSLPLALAAVALAGARALKSRQAVRAARGGVLVLADRWPALTGSVDAPRLEAGGATGTPIWWLSRVEFYLYAKVRPADVAALFRVTIENVLTRIGLRDGNDPRLEAGARERYRLSRNISVVSKRRVLFSNNGPTVAGVRRLVVFIQKELSGRRLDDR